MSATWTCANCREQRPAGQLRCACGSEWCVGEPVVEADTPEELMEKLAVLMNPPEAKA